MVSLDCGTSAVTWQRHLASDFNSGLVDFNPASNGNKYSVSGGLLTIQSLAPEDEGIYNCSSMSFCVLAVRK